MFDVTVYEQLKINFGIDLPQDFLFFHRNYKSDFGNEKFFWIIENDWGSEIEELYRMEKSGDSVEYSLIDYLEGFGPSYKPGYLAIGEDGCGGYILLNLNNGDFGAIYFCTAWSEDGENDVYDSQAYWKIADSFTIFLNNLMVAE